jgi:hypothetical protein
MELREESSFPSTCGPVASLTNGTVVMVARK